MRLIQNPGDAALSQLELAVVLLRESEVAEAKALAEASLEAFVNLGQSLRSAQAQLVMAEIAAAQGENANALTLLEQVEATAQSQTALWLLYQGQWQRGRLLWRSTPAAESASDKLTAALTCFESAVETLERLRGRLMTEFRADFLQDKEGVYADMVRLCLQMNRPKQALDYVERSRSRTLDRPDRLSTRSEHRATFHR